MFPKRHMQTKFVPKMKKNKSLYVEEKEVIAYFGSLAEFSCLDLFRPR